MMNIKIALTDDHHLVRKGIKYLLETFKGLSVIIETSSGIELITQIQQTEIKPDIVLLDIGMPTMDGFDVANTLLEILPQIKIIGLSVDVSRPTVKRMIEVGARAYLPKESTPEIVYETILQVHSKGYHYSQLVIDSFMEWDGEQKDDNKSKSISQEILLLLTQREIKFIQHCCSEMTYKEIASVMNVSQRTVDGYRDSIFMKLHLKSRTGIVLFAIKHKFHSII